MIELDSYECGIILDRNIMLAHCSMGIVVELVNCHIYSLVWLECHTISVLHRVVVNFVWFQDEIKYLLYCFYHKCLIKRVLNERRFIYSNLYYRLPSLLDIVVQVRT